MVFSIKRFGGATRKLPSDKPKSYPSKLYRTQEDHWIEWLQENNGSGEDDPDPGQAP